MLFAEPPLAAAVVAVVVVVEVVFADSVCANVPFNRVGAAANAATYIAIARIFGPVPLEIFINVLEATDIFKYYLIRLSFVRFYRFAFNPEANLLHKSPFLSIFKQIRANF
jgi:hypothetical protein